MVNLIINADDFGYNEGRTRAILEFFGSGLISNTTLMVNRPFAAQAVELSRAAGVDDRIGLHLNLTEGIPLTDPIKSDPLFCDATGAFSGRFHVSLKTRLRLPLASQAVLREELAAQLQRFLDFGLPERHFDSHHHAHTDLSVAAVLFPLARDMGFRSCRLSLRVRPTSRALAKGLYKAVFNRRARKVFATADAFLGMGEFLRCLALWEGRTVEVMTHPLRCRNGFCDIADQSAADYETPAVQLEDFLSRVSGRVRLIPSGELA